MKFIVELDKMAIIQTLIDDGDIDTAEQATKEELCSFVLSSIGLQIDGLEPKTDIKVEIIEN